MRATQSHLSPKGSTYFSQCVPTSRGKGNIDLTLKLTSKMLRAESASGQAVILKLTDEHEVDVLRHLHRSDYTMQTRIIPLLDVLDVVGGRLMVLPLRTPLLHFLDLEASVDDVAELALQFLEGVRYLQDSSVAHLDLKPDNIVVQRDAKLTVDLAIIDFDIAVFADAEPIISGLTGTVGWCAPEVVQGNRYDPLAADRWSCGRVLTLFARYMGRSRLQELIVTLAQQLQEPNPSKRPPIPATTGYCGLETKRMLDLSSGAPTASRPRRSGRPLSKGPQDRALGLRRAHSQRVFGLGGKGEFSRV